MIMMMRPLASKMMMMIVSDPPRAPEKLEFVLQEVSSAVGKVGNHSIYSEL